MNKSSFTENQVETSHPNDTDTTITENSKLSDSELFLAPTQAVSKLSESELLSASTQAVDKFSDSELMLASTQAVDKLSESELLLASTQAVNRTSESELFLAPTQDVDNLFAIKLLSAETQAVAKLSESELIAAETQPADISVETQGIDVLTAETQVVEIEDAETQAVKDFGAETQAVEAETVETQAINTEASYTQAVEVEEAETQAIDMNFKPGENLMENVSLQPEESALLTQDEDPAKNRLNGDQDDAIVHEIDDFDDSDMLFPATQEPSTSEKSRFVDITEEPTLLLAPPIEQDEPKQPPGAGDISVDTNSRKRNPSLINLSYVTLVPGTQEENDDYQNPVEDDDESELSQNLLEDLSDDEYNSLADSEEAENACSEVEPETEASKGTEDMNSRTIKSQERLELTKMFNEVELRGLDSPRRPGAQCNLELGTNGKVAIENQEKERIENVPILERQDSNMIIATSQETAPPRTAGVRGKLIETNYLALSMEQTSMVATDIVCSNSQGLQRSDSLNPRSLSQSRGSCPKSPRSIPILEETQSPIISRSQNVENRSLRLCLESSELDSPIIMKSSRSGSVASKLFESIGLGSDEEDTDVSVMDPDKEKVTVSGSQGIEPINQLIESNTINGTMSPQRFENSTSIIMKTPQKPANSPSISTKTPSIHANSPRIDIQTPQRPESICMKTPQKHQSIGMKTPPRAENSPSISMKTPQSHETSNFMCLKKYTPQRPDSGPLLPDTQELICQILGVKSTTKADPVINKENVEDTTEREEEPELGRVFLFRLTGPGAGSDSSSITALLRRDDLFTEEFLVEVSSRLILYSILDRGSLFLPFPLFPAEPDPGTVFSLDATILRRAFPTALLLIVFDKSSSSSSLDGTKLFVPLPVLPTVSLFRS